VRGGDDTVTTLQTLWAAGARLAVVTAAAASPDNARLIANLLRRLALAREFASAALDTAPLLTLLRSLAPPAAATAADAADAASTADAATTEETTTTTRPATADCEQTEKEEEEVKEEEREKREERRRRLERETKRTVALLALSTGRRPGDLVRIGHSTIAFDAARSKATYRLAQITGTNAGGWSALQSLAAHEERELCAVDCLAAYMDLTASRRTREGANIPDRLLLSLDEEENGVLDENAVSKLLEEVLVEAGINPQSPEARELFQDSAELVTLDGGVKIARYRHIMCARYNKPEALLDFVTRLGQTPPKKILFVDDNSDNVFNMFHFFASRQLEQLAAGSAVEETTSVISCWFPPPEGGKAEPHDPHLLALLRRMAAL
jgi:cell wall-associated NlpC family hydrolase